MEWQPIETAPRDGTSILIFCPHYGISRVEYRKSRSGDWRILSDDYMTAFDSSGDDVWNDTATHWMPLPAPPEAK